MKSMQEMGFQLIGTFSNIKVYESNHAYEEFIHWFPKLSKDDYKKVLSQGIEKIRELDTLTELNQYMIISKSTKIRIPLELRLDRCNKNKLMGIIPTTLGEFETKSLRNEVEVFIEQNKNSYHKFLLREGFNYYVQHGKVFSDFTEIEVD